MSQAFLAGSGELDDANVAELDAPSLGAIGQDIGHPALVGYPDAEALQGTVVVDYLLPALGLPVRQVRSVSATIGIFSLAECRRSKVWACSAM